MRIEWILRAVSTKTFLAKLKAIEDEIEEYKSKTEGKPLEDRLKESMSYYVKQKVGKEVGFSNTKKYIKNLVSRKTKILPKQESELKTRILEDLFLASVEEKEAVKLTDELSEYIKEEMDKLWSERR